MAVGMLAFWLPGVWSKNQPSWGPKSHFGVILGAFWEHFGVLGGYLEGVAKKSPKRCQKPPHMEAKILPKSIKNRSKIDQKSDQVCE